MLRITDGDYDYFMLLLNGNFSTTLSVAQKFSKHNISKSGIYKHHGYMENRTGNPQFP